ncbi:hypothetical protein RDWZM_010235 [Blomia tropicalis]|uniref:Sorting nexin C-terminal domain-containing protein n=1 Tax=Blomia tropicalis TaxID=40697 RepID=A0A9Q0M1B4_BLOTA|nr:hypothetical protein RDWZM_010235 [Blomia tropicalis]
MTFSESFGSSPLGSSRTLKLLLTDLLSTSIRLLINLITDPVFVDMQLIKMVERKADLNIKHDSQQLDHMNRESISPNNELSIIDLKQCLAEHNFNRLMEILDQCDDIDQLKTIRLNIIGEILDAAVIEYLMKQQQQQSRPDVDENGSNSSRTTSASLPSSSSTSTIFQQIRSFTNPSMEHNNKIRSKWNDLKNGSASFNAKIVGTTKYRSLKAKDIRRLISKLRYAKTICEQKISIQRRHDASLLIVTSPTGTPNTVNQSRNSSVDDWHYSFDLSFNSDLVGSFGANEIPQQQQLRKKNIFKFESIMANEYGRTYFKRFLTQSLFNHGEQRTSRNKFRKDILISECCSYLVDVWQMTQSIFEMYLKSDDQHCNGIDLHTRCYLLAARTISDSRFYYTFSSRFLQLPIELLRSLESFLLGDLNINSVMAHCNIEQLVPKWMMNTTEPFDENCTQSQTESQCLSSIYYVDYLDMFHQLERIIYKCLCDQFYPQFLISNEYDQMLTNYSLINTERRLYTTQWYEDDERRRRQQGRRTFDSTRPIQRIIIHNETIDIVKNRTMLLNCLHFPLFYLLSTITIVQCRLALKIHLKRTITNHHANNGQHQQHQTMVPLFVDLIQLLNHDIIYYHDAYASLHSILTAAYCWLRSDFNCTVCDLRFGTERLDGTPSTSSSSSSIEMVTFRLNVDAQTIGLNQHSSSIRSELCSTFATKWTIANCSLQTIFSNYRYGMMDNLRMMTYLTRYNIVHFVHCLGDCMESTIKRSHDGTNNRLSYWNKLIKHLAQDQLAIKKAIRNEKRQQMKKIKSGIQPERVPETPLSFRRLLDQERRQQQQQQDIVDGSIETNESIGDQNQPIYPQSSESIRSIERLLNQFFTHLCSDRELMKTNGILAMIQYAQPRSISQGSCVRCLLYQLLMDNGDGNDLNRFVHETIINSMVNGNCIELDSLLFNRTVDSNQIMEIGRSTTNLLESAFNLPSMFLSSNTGSSSNHSNTNHCGLPRLDDTDVKSAEKLTYLHARSLLNDQSSIEMLDHSLSSLRYFARFCSQCSERMDSHSRFTSSEWTALECDSSIYSFDDDDDDPFDRTSQPNQLIGGIEESNILEPSFQLLVEVFELKGSNMIRTFRRTLMFAFRLIFGPQLFSRQFKMSLDSMMNESNVLHVINHIDHQLDGWIERKTSSTASHEPELDTNLERIQLVSKQLIFASMPTFVNHLFGNDNMVTGLNKTFDLIQYESLNRQLIYVCFNGFVVFYL